MFRNRYNTAILSLASVMFLAGCSDWTRPESMELETPSLEKDNPELWQAYLASLREYKASEHKIMMVRFNNQPGIPSGQVQRLSAFPDSVDYIILENPEEVSDTHQQEMARAGEMGTKFLFSVDFDEIMSKYEAYVEEWNGKQEETGSEEGEPIPITDFISNETERIIASASKYSFEGLIAQYVGMSPTSMPPAKKELWKGYQDAFFGTIQKYMSAHPDMELIFRGIPINIIDNNALIESFRYVIIECYDAKTADAVTFECRLAISDDIPQCRIIPDVMIPSISDPTDERGNFLTLDQNGKKISAIIGTADWAIRQDKYMQRTGVCASRAWEDYYQAGLGSNYSRLRKAISTMNYSPEL